MLRLRALLAVVLFVGFYALALGMAGGLLFLVYAQFAYAERVHAQLSIFAVVGAFLIVRAVLPRIDRFAPPGPLLTREAEPRLHAMVDEVARATGQAPPAEVYLVPEVNAFVMERGGVLGVGSRRVMGIGLPLLDLLSVAEFRAVVAHEFGHFIGGDTRLGPWIYRTRAAIGRTLEAVGGHSAWLVKPFEWYATGFLRVTHAVSRAQEYVADATAAQVAGGAAARRALVRIEGGAAAYDAFWHTELAPALGHGFRPPLVDGLRRFLTAPRVAVEMERIVERALREPTTDPYDTHPCLHDRLAALDAIPAAPPTVPEGSEGDAPATALLADLPAREQQLLAQLIPARSLATVSWDAVPTVVLPIGWRELVGPHAAVLAGLTPAQLPALAADPARLAARVRVQEAWRSPEEPGAQAAARLLGAALALAVLQRVEAGIAGVVLEAPPGEPVRAMADGDAILPFSACDDLAAGALTAERWTAWVERAGIAGTDLGTVARAATASDTATPAPVRA